MKIRGLLFAMLISTFLASCAVIEKTAKTMDIYGAGVIQNPVLVDLDVKETKVSGSATGGIGTALENIKQYAVTDALNKANADILVQPKFEIETSEGQSTVTVTGFPATYKNFRSMKPEDAPLLQSGLSQKTAVYEPSKEPQKKATGPFLGALFIVTLVVLTLLLA